MCFLIVRHCGELICSSSSPQICLTISSQESRTPLSIFFEESRLGGFWELRCCDVRLFLVLMMTYTHLIVLEGRHALASVVI